MTYYIEDKIIEGIARTLFVCTYADGIDSGDLEGPAAGPGQDWMDIAPPTPHSAFNTAWRLAGKLEQANGMGILSLIYKADAADRGLKFGDLLGREDCFKYAKDFGSDLAMMALGHGVSWFDDHAKFDLEVPDIEYEVTQEECEEFATADEFDEALNKARYFGDYDLDVCPGAKRNEVEDGIWVESWLWLARE